MKKNREYTQLSDVEKQKSPLSNEVTPENAFIKLSSIAVHVAAKYKLKTLKLNDKNT